MSGQTPPQGQHSGAGPSNASHAGKTIISSKIHTDARNTSQNGMMELIETRIITDYYSDGTESTRRETHTIREEEISGGTVGVSSFNPPSLNGPYVPNVPIMIPQPLQLPNNGQGTGQRQGGGSVPNTLIVLNNPNPQRTSQSLPPPAGRTDDVFIEEALRCHNKYRALHHSPPLTVSKDLCQAAQTWADQLLHKGSMENSHFGYGENIYWSSAPGQAMKGDVPVEYWYNEENNYDWNKMDFQKTTGSFTQMIWKNSTSFGIGKSTGPNGTYVVAFYVPPGNILGKFRDNIFRK